MVILGVSSDLEIPSSRLTMPPNAIIVSNEDLESIDIELSQELREIRISQESIADDGRRWSVFSCSQKAMQFIREEAQQIKNGFITYRHACTDFCGRNSGKIVVIAIMTTACVGLVFYGDYCLIGQRDGDSSPACYQNKLGKSHSGLIGAGVLFGSILSCAMASFTVLRPIS
jgi:hypothetical protein